MWGTRCPCPLRAPIWECPAECSPDGRSSSTGFRDRYSPAGAKDASLDARVLADALRTDRHLFRRIDPVDPVVIELRAWSRIDEDLTTGPHPPVEPGAGASYGATTRRSSKAWSSLGFLDL
ncbi:MAG: transposase [Gemmatimonadota bacterium]|nr:transposase [Gemmatimonadota bacterium]